MRKEVIVMQLERYEKAEMEIIEFDEVDIMGSGESSFGYEDEDEGF